MTDLNIMLDILGERAEQNKADAQFFQRGQDLGFGFGFAPLHRGFTLDVLNRHPQQFDHAFLVRGGI